MTREEEIETTKAMYAGFIREIESHLAKIRHEQQKYRSYKGVWAKSVVIKLGIKIQYHEGQKRQMERDLARALSRIR